MREDEDVGRHPLLRARTLLILAGVATIACEERPRSTNPLARDSAGIAIIETPTGGLDGLPQWRLGEPEVVLGASLANPAHQFSHVVGGFRLSDGSILIGDEESRELRLFSAAGEPRRIFAGKGEGPGELPFLYRVALEAGDTIAVSARPFGFLSRFDPNGKYLDGRRLGPFRPGQTSEILADGTLLLDYYDGGHGNNVELWARDGDELKFRPRGFLVRVFEDGRMDTLRPVIGQEWFKHGTWRRDLWVAPQPLGPVTVTAVAAGRVFVGETDRAEIEVRALDGTIERIFRWTAQPVPVTRRDRDRVAEAAREGLRQPNRAPHLDRWLAAVVYPEIKPPVLGLHAARTGSLWVQFPTDAADERDRWIAFDPDGTPLAEIRPVAGSRLLEVDDTHALLVRTNELDVERVELRKLTRG